MILPFISGSDPGLALPLVSLQNSEVYINVTLRAMNDLYTVVDVDPGSTTYESAHRSCELSSTAFPVSSSGYRSS
jgi:hypothetical protein